MGEFSVADPVVESTSSALLTGLFKDGGGTENECGETSDNESEKSSASHEKRKKRQNNEIEGDAHERRATTLPPSSCSVEDDGDHPHQLQVDVKGHIVLPLPEEKSNQERYGESSQRLATIIIRGMTIIAYLQIINDSSNIRPTPLLGRHKSAVLRGSSC